MRTTNSTSSMTATDRWLISDSGFDPERADRRKDLGCPVAAVVDAAAAAFGRS